MGALTSSTYTRRAALAGYLMNRESDNAPMKDDIRPIDSSRTSSSTGSDIGPLGERCASLT
jgi:hypothetical protein